MQIDDDFDVDEFIQRENSKIKKRYEDLSTTNISFFNIEHDEIFDIDLKNFEKDNKVNTTIAKDFSKQIKKPLKEINNPDSNKFNSPFNSELSQISPKENKDFSNIDENIFSELEKNKNKFTDVDLKIIDEVKNLLFLLI